MSPEMVDLFTIELSTFEKSLGMMSPCTRQAELELKDRWGATKHQMLMAEKASIRTKTMTRVFGCNAFIKPPNNVLGNFATRNVDDPICWQVFFKLCQFSHLCRAQIDGVAHRLSLVLAEVRIDTKGEMRWYPDENKILDGVWGLEKLVHVV